MYLDILLFCVVFLGFSFIVTKVNQVWLSGPILFVAAGLLLGPLGLNWFSLSIEQETLKTLSEITLAVVLFSDAATVSWGNLRRYSQIPMRMLLLGLPLTLLLGFVIATYVFPQLSLLEAALLATILAPTDAALGQAVVQNDAVPKPLSQGLNVESGLNDGICVPVLLVLLTYVSGSGQVDEVHHSPLYVFAEELGIGLVVGGVGIWLCVSLIKKAKSLGWMPVHGSVFLMVAMGLASFALAQYIGGSGFIAAFCGGLLYGHLDREGKAGALHTTESTGEVLSMVTWILFGAAVVGHSLEYVTWPVLLFAILSLTLIRMLPIYLSLMGTDLNTESRCFLGWFGPRGLASIVFAIMVMEANLPHAGLISAVVSVTIVSSILLHGISATPWANRWKVQTHLKLPNNAKLL